jgi:hypothetical protein
MPINGARIGIRDDLPHELGREVKRYVAGDRKCDARQRLSEICQMMIRSKRKYTPVEYKDLSYVYLPGGTHGPQRGPTSTSFSAMHRKEEETH